MQRRRLAESVLTAGNSSARPQGRILPSLLLGEFRLGVEESGARQEELWSFALPVPSPLPPPWLAHFRTFTEETIGHEHEVDTKGSH